jgi:hypothetical protein
MARCSALVCGLRARAMTRSAKSRISCSNLGRYSKSEFGEQNAQNASFRMRQLIDHAVLAGMGACIGLHEHPLLAPREVADLEGCRDVLAGSRTR